MIKAIIFDMNGVVIDDEKIHELAFEKSLEPFKIPFSHFDYLNCCAGKTDASGYEAISEKFHLNLPVESLVAQKHQLYIKYFPKYKQEIPGASTLINKIFSKYKLALTTGALKSEVDIILKELDLSGYFDVIVTGNDVVHGKPDPEPYLKTISQLNLSPEECLVIEDSKSGIIAAKRAGCKCIAITTSHSPEDLELADNVIDRFEDILLVL